MIKLKKPSPHLVLGIIAGFLVALFIIAQGSYLMWATEVQKLDINVLVLNGIINILAVISFVIIIVISNTSWFKKINLNKLSIYFLFAILVSILASFATVNLAGGVMESLYLEEPINIFKVNLTATLLISSVVLVFVATFVLLINRKVKYIKFITTEVKKIKDEGFGKTIKVQGKDELSDLTKSINLMSIELKEKRENEIKLENNKNELITSVSHDLRTPLTSIMGYIDLIKKGEYKDEEQFIEYVNIIDEKSKNLNKLINELFEYTKLNSYDIKLNYSEVDIVALVQQLIGEYTYIFNKIGLTLLKDIPDKDIYINVDVEKIVRVLDNLLTNAKKYSISNSEILLTLKEDNKNVIISLANRTNEIKQEDLPNIFERFYKGDKSRKEAESSGIGLSIAKRIVELHKGAIDVHFNDNIISFIVKIPL